MNKPENRKGPYVVLIYMLLSQRDLNDEGQTECTLLVDIFWTPQGFQNTNDSLLSHCFKTKVEWQRSQRRHHEIGLFWLCAILSDSVVCLRYANQARVCEIAYISGTYLLQVSLLHHYIPQHSLSNFCSPAITVLWKYNGKSYCCSCIQYMYIIDVLFTFFVELMLSRSQLFWSCCITNVKVFVPHNNGTGSSALHICTQLSNHTLFWCVNLIIKLNSFLQILRNY